MMGLQLPMLQAGAAGAVPGPANWTDIVAALSGVTNEQTISVGEPTLLRAEVSSPSFGGGGNGALLVLVNNAEAGSINSFTNAGEMTDFLVAEGDVVKFAGNGDGDVGWFADCVVTIKYGAPSFASTLDTFNVNLGS